MSLNPSLSWLVIALSLAATVLRAAAQDPTISGDGLVVSNCRWQSGLYSPCSHTCDGVRVRNVNCRCEAIDGRTVEGTDDDCLRDDENLKPDSSESCGVQCVEYKWVTEQWRLCSVECGLEGLQDRIVYCQESTVTSATSTDERDCLQADVARRIGPKPTTERACNATFRCQYIVSNWGECSNSCGGGRRARTLACDKVDDDGITTSAPLQTCQNDRTIGETPKTIEDCNTQPCLSRCLWVANAYSACSETCEGTKTRTVSCRCSLPDGSPAAGTDVDCTRDDPRAKPTTNTSCGVECANYSWVPSNWTACSSVCSFGTRTRTLRCLKEREGRTFATNESDCLDPGVQSQIGTKPAASQICDNPCSYNTTEWSSCSTSCGGGIRTRLVTCLQEDEEGSTQIVDISNCEAYSIRVGAKPPARQDCNTDECGFYRWRTGAYSDCSRTCEGTQTRKVFCAYVHPSGRDDTVAADINCLREDPQDKPSNSRPCGEECATFGWVAEEYGICSAICGYGTQTRNVYCMRTTNSSQVRVHGGYCSRAGPMPQESRACDPQPKCEYVGSQWSDCSHTCGSGTQRRTVQCYQLSQLDERRLVRLQHCQFDRTLPEPFPPPIRRECNTGVECVDHKWTTGLWQTCSSVCGPGIQIRRVVCQSIIRSGVRSGLTLDVQDTDCVKVGLNRKPPTSRPCDPQPSCKYDIGFWSRCPVTCGTGISTRRVDCLQSIPYRRTRAIALGFCVNDSSIDDPLPPSERLCSTSVCPVRPAISPAPSSAPPPPLDEDLHYSVGRDIHVITNRALTIDCVETQAIPNATIEWRLSNGAVLEKGESLGRFRVAENDSLIITRVTLQDDGMYRCIATNIAGRDVASSQVTVYQRPQIIENTVRVRGFLISLQADSGPVFARPNNEVVLTCKIAIVQPKPDVKWYRQGSEVTTSDRVTIQSDGSLLLTSAQLDDGDNYTCIATNVLGNDSSVMWLAINDYDNHWVAVAGSCSRTCATGSRVISSECRRKNDSLLVSNEECREQRRPLAVREPCAEIPCKGRWEVGQFDHCSSSCEGVQMRTVTCVQQQRNRQFVVVSDSVCDRDDPNPKPPFFQPCGDECSIYTWETTSWSTCSLECGYGTQKRNVTCMKQTGLIRVTPDENTCSRRVGGKPAEERTCQPLPRCRYAVSEWSACSATCDSGVKTRTLSCVKTEQNNMEKRLSLDHCASRGLLAQPSLIENCYRRNCPCILPRWISSRWRTCPRTCGGAVQVRDVLCSCTLRGRQQFAPESVCQGIENKPATRRACGQIQCPCERHRWRKRDWEGCSVSCGTGIERRQVTCECKRAGQIETSKDPQRCLIYPQPPSQRECYEPACPCSNPEWHTGNWSECSATCKGTRTRRVVCICGGETAETDVCLRRVTDQPQPSRQETCSGPCPCENYRYREGGWLSCSRTCGNGTQSRTLSCYCDLERRRMIRPIKECETMLTQAAPITIRSCSSSDCPCEVARYTTGPWSSCSHPCGGNQNRKVECHCFREEAWATASDDECYFAGHRRPLNIKQCAPCQYRWLATPWKRCLPTCSRHRTVYCTDQYGNEVKNSHCREFTEYEKPSTKERCFYNGTKGKVVWIVSSWSPCSKACQGGTKRRAVTCINPCKQIKATGCIRWTRPRHLKTCNTFACDVSNCKDSYSPMFCGFVLRTNLCTTEGFASSCCKTCRLGTVVRLEYQQARNS